MRGPRIDRILDVVGEKTNRLIYLRSQPGPQPYKRRRAVYLCDCGTEKVIEVACVRRGLTQSCGCLNQEKRHTNHRTHGLTGCPEYKTWASMLSRCGNALDPGFKHYGGRGIRVCDCWHDFSSFYADMGVRPTLKHTLDRIDNDGNYEPGNCRWATPATQARNKSTTHFITFNGDTRCLKDWARAIGISEAGLIHRLRTWPSVTEAMTRPARRGSPGAGVRKGRLHKSP